MDGLGSVSNGAFSNGYTTRQVETVVFKFIGSRLLLRPIGRWVVMRHRAVRSRSRGPFADLPFSSHLSANICKVCTNDEQLKIAEKAGSVGVRVVFRVGNLERRRGNAISGPAGLVQRWHSHGSSYNVPNPFVLHCGRNTGCRMDKRANRLGKGREDTDMLHDQGSNTISFTTTIKSHEIE
ncbi:unnamed protein product [Darwinula stevensoni]|uniref:Uncharacterized protein n=1 Tax=Darwinula stevensoni TaxID=69355 RepID=A0A7R9AE16_9CRUS|nr:unnamed protein product [Darwinula stevensoni]CAG0901902.1 unnamed protein product [Darwinula stevensoni]